MCILTAAVSTYDAIALDNMVSSSSDDSPYSYDVIEFDDPNYLWVQYRFNDAIDPESKLPDDPLCLDQDASNKQLLAIAPHLPEVCKHFSDPTNSPDLFGADFYCLRLPRPDKGRCSRKELSVSTLICV